MIQHVSQNGRRESVYPKYARQYVPVTQHYRMSSHEKVHQPRLRAMPGKNEEERNEQLQVARIRDRYNSWRRCMQTRRRAELGMRS